MPHNPPVSPRVKRQRPTGSSPSAADSPADTFRPVRKKARIPSSDGSESLLPVAAASVQKWGPQKMVCDACPAAMIRAGLFHAETAIPGEVAYCDSADMFHGIQAQLVAHADSHSKFEQFTNSDLFTQIPDVAARAGWIHAKDFEASSPSFLMLLLQQAPYVSDMFAAPIDMQDSKSRTCRVHADFKGKHHFLALRSYKEREEGAVIRADVSDHDALHAQYAALVRIDVSDDVKIPVTGELVWIRKTVDASGTDVLRLVLALLKTAGVQALGLHDDMRIDFYVSKQISYEYRFRLFKYLLCSEEELEQKATWYTQHGFQLISGVELPTTEEANPILSQNVIEYASAMRYVRNFHVSKNLDAIWPLLSTKVSKDFTPVDLRKFKTKLKEFDGFLSVLMKATYEGARAKNIEKAKFFNFLYQYVLNPESYSPDSEMRHALEIIQEARMFVADLTEV